MRKYLIILASITGTLVAAATVANYCIDPYAISGVQLPRDLNAIKPTFGDHHVFGKPFIAARRQPTAVIFGTSRENHGIDPDSPAWPAPADSRYNLAMDAANIVDIERLFEHITRVSNVQEVVIALDFLNMFDANAHGAVNFDADLLVADHHPPALVALNSLRYFTSWSMLRDSLETIRHQDSRQIEFEPAGRRNSLVFESVANRVGQQYMFSFSETRYFRARINLPIEQRWSSMDTSGRSTLLHLAKILDRAAELNIKLKLYMTPVHARQLEIYRLLGLWDTFEEWKRTVVKIAEGSLLRDQRRSFALWDFSDYSAVTTESVPEPGDLTTRMRWYWESSHYTRATGDLVLDRIFARPNPALPMDFGVAIHSGEIDKHLATIRQHGETYRASHARDIDELNRAKTEVVASGIVLAM